MAGSKIFLEPILTETVGGIQTAVDEVVAVVDPVPEKIDEQINALQQVANVIGSSLSNINVTDGNTFKFPIIKSVALDCGVALPTTGEPATVTATRTRSVTFKTLVNGLFKIVWPESVLTLRSWGNSLGGTIDVEINYTLSKNGNTIKTGTIASISVDNEPGRISEDQDISVTDIDNIVCEFNDEFTFSCEIIATQMAGAGAVEGDLYARGLLSTQSILATYELVDVLTNGIKIS